MDRPNEKILKPKIFTQVFNPLHSKAHEFLFECPLYKKQKGKKPHLKPCYMRFYEKYMLLANVNFIYFGKKMANVKKDSNFEKKKVCFYDFQCLATFNDAKEKKNAKGKVFKSFKINKNQEKMKFMIKNNGDFYRVKEILKRKLNFSDYNENFKNLKIIGSGYFANVCFLILSKVSSFNIKGVPDAKRGVKKILRCEMHAENVYFQQKKRISNILRHFY